MLTGGTSVAEGARPTRSGKRPNHAPRFAAVGMVFVRSFRDRDRRRGFCPAAVTREDVDKAIRDAVRFLKSNQRDDGSWTDIELEARTGVTSLVTLALMTAGEPANSPAIRKSTRLSPPFRAGRAAQHVCHLAPDDGLRNGRARARSVADRGQRPLARAGPDQAQRRRFLAGLVDLLRHETPPGRQFQLPVRPSGPARRQRSRGAGQARGVGARAHVLGKKPEDGRKLGLHA